MKGISPRVRGFTLLEIMVLLLVVAVVLTMAIPAYRKIREAQHASPAPLPVPAKQ